ncbi:MAG: hypothetical protein PWP46_658 [Fusobacteriaceae bacterium]|jgi:rhodanese-related sulfurtransferase|nr:Rhodanese domain protein [Fusobacteriales bacterium]MDN5303779.1 hypothetical protein [Fusobacteriaceae bacterium]
MKKIVLLLMFIIFTISFSDDEKIYKNINVKTFSNLVKTGEYIVLDVRTPEEYNNGHVANSINIDFYSNKFVENIKKLDRNKKYILYCRSGNRSGRTMYLMKELEFNRWIKIIIKRELSFSKIIRF